MGSTYSLLKPLHSHFIRSSIVLVLFQGMGNVPSGKNDNVILKYVIAHAYADFSRWVTSIILTSNCGILRQCEGWW